MAADQRSTVPSRLTNASEQRARGGDGVLSFAIVCASLSLTPTLRVHRHRAISGLLSRCAPSFLGRRPRPRPFEFTRPLPRLGRGPRCVSSGVQAYTRWAGRLRHHASNTAGAHTPSVGYLLVTSLRTQEVWVVVDKRLVSLSFTLARSRSLTLSLPNLKTGKLYFLRFLPFVCFAEEKVLVHFWRVPSCGRQERK